MSKIENLPLAGAKFSAKSGLGSFQNKFTHSIHAAGELSAFGRHPEAAKSLMDQVAKNQHYIRRGGLSSAQIKKIASEVTKSDPTLTKAGKELVHKTLSHLRPRSITPAEQPELLGGHAPDVMGSKPGQFNYRPVKKATQHITSVGNLSGKTSSFHQFGDTVSRTKGGARSGEIYGSASAAAKGNRAARLKSEEDKNNSAVIPTIPQDEIPK